MEMLSTYSSFAGLIMEKWSCWLLRISDALLLDYAHLLEGLFGNRGQQVLKDDDDCNLSFFPLDGWAVDPATRGTYHPPG